MLAADDE
jgi:hypothetical protein